MERLKLLIADDLEKYRVYLREICQTMEDFEIREACDGIEASKIIKTWHTQTINMALTTVIDPNMEKNMASIRVAANIRKSADKEFIRFKPQSPNALLYSKERGVLRALSKKSA